MKKSNLSFCQWCDEWSESRQDQFTYEAKKALYNYLENYEEETDEEIEVDIVALCCEYTEYSDLEDLQANYSDIESMEDLEDHTIVIPCYSVEGNKLDSFIIQDF